MSEMDIKCPICKSTKVSKYGESSTGKQRYICRNKECPQKTFQLEYNYNACKPKMQEQIIDMAANANGIRETARILKISTYKVMNTLRKQG